MTTVELRTSIAAELDQMSVEMLESVSRYVSRLRRRARPSRRVSSVQDRREAAMLFVKNLSVQGGLPVPSDESGIDALVDEPNQGDRSLIFLEPKGCGSQAGCHILLVVAKEPSAY